MNPVFFWTMLLFMFGVGMMLANAFYWDNVRYEQMYRIRRWKELRASTSGETESSGDVPAPISSIAA
jgi:hypothetical protein